MNLRHALIFASLLGSIPVLAAQEDPSGQVLQAALDRIAELERRLAILEQLQPSPAAPEPPKPGPAAPPVRTEGPVDPAAGWTAIHVIEEGQTLSSIAREHKTSAIELARRNGIGDANRIKAGQELRVPGEAGSAPVPPASVPAPVPAAAEVPAAGAVEADYSFYTVEPGDTWLSVADRFFTTVSEISSLNEVDTRRVLQVGQQVKVPTRRYFEEKRRLESGSRTGPMLGN